jgi:hypothetical protein
LKSGFESYMANRNKVLQSILMLLPMLGSIALVSCAIPQQPVQSPKEKIQPVTTEMKMQSLVMDMADDYIAALGESMYLLTRSGKLDSKGRWLAQSYLRNGVGASLDIAVGPNPPVSLLDLLAMTSLQTWSFETHWIPAGIGEAGLPALDRLRRAEANVWESAKVALSDEQLSALRGLINAWISENSDRTVVALVRFNEFADERRLSSSSLRGQAQGLLAEVSEASEAVDEARLLGERLLWFAGRYPYLLGEQAELTAYRLIDQPEGAQFTEALKSAQKLSDALAERIGTIQNDLKEQQGDFFTQISTERMAAIAQLQAALEATVNESLDHASDSIKIQRIEGINQLFDRLAQERTLILDDISSRQGQLLGLMTELRETIAASGTLAGELTGTVNAIDRVVSRFDIDPNSNRQPLNMTDVRDAALETGNAADRITLFLERAIELIESESFDQKILTMTNPADAIVDKLFWRGVILICLLIVGVGILRFVPQRIRGRQDVNVEK